MRRGLDPDAVEAVWGVEEGNH